MMNGSINVWPARAAILIEVLLGSAVFVVAHTLAGVQIVVFGSEAEWREGGDSVRSASIGASTVIFFIVLVIFSDCVSNCSTNSTSCSISHCSIGSTCDINIGQGVNGGTAASAEWVALPHLR